MISGQVDAGTNAGNGGFLVAAVWYLVGPSGTQYTIASCGPLSGLCNAGVGTAYTLPEGPGMYHFAVKATFNGLFSTDQTPNPLTPLNVSLTDVVTTQ